MIETILDAPVHGWLAGKSQEIPIVLTSRIRLARNFKDLPFTNLNHQDSLQKVNQMMRSIMSELTKKDGKEYGNISLDKLSEEERAILMEKHLISPMLNDHPNERSLVVSEDASVAIMVNEEDHLRIQVMESGLNLAKAYERACHIDDAIESKYNYAFSEKYGYLTACPTNVGTGMRASVMVHLPGLTLTQGINRIFRSIARLGYTVRGLYGEGTSSLGNIYQISNQVTMGVSEEETIEQLTKVVSQLVKEEEQCRQQLLSKDPIGLEDRVFRAYGVLKYARKLTGNEALELISELQLGIDLGLVPIHEEYSFHNMIIVTRPNYLQKYAGKSGLTSEERDVLRAQVIGEALKD